MKAPRATLLLGASATFAIALPSAAHSQTTTAALVEEIQGTVFFRKSANATAIKLDPKVDLGRRLYVGEQVQSARGGVLRIRRGGESRVVRGPSAWFTIRPLLSPQTKATQALLEEYGRPGGRTRADPSLVFSPSPHSVVIPEEFVIRWNQGPAIRTIALIIQVPGGGVVWRQDGVGGAPGSLASEPARQALATYRAEMGEGPLLLRVVDSDSNVTQVSFSLISALGEQSLRQELALWDRDTGQLVSHLGRASVFARARMFAQAADEYEAALLAAPESRDLLISTILSHRRTGNVARVEELTTRLPDGTAVP